MGNDKHFLHRVVFLLGVLVLLALIFGARLVQFQLTDDSFTLGGASSGTGTVGASAGGTVGTSGEMSVGTSAGVSVGASASAGSVAPASSSVVA